MSQPFHHMTDHEIIQHATLRDDLSPLETELLDRLIRSNDEVSRLSGQTYEATTTTLADVPQEVMAG